MSVPKSEGDDELIEDVCRHLEPELGEVARVYHDEVNEWVHVDVHIVPKADCSPFVSLFTTGMSERFMTVPVGARKPARAAELLMTLPPDWPCDERSLENPHHFWPFAWLRFLARFPFRNRTFLGVFHTIPGMVAPDLVDPPSPFHAAILLPPRRLTAAARAFARRGSRETTVVLAVAPLFESERAFARDRGTRELLERFRQSEVDPEIVDVYRAPVVV